MVRYLVLFVWREGLNDFRLPELLSVAAGLGYTVIVGDDTALLAGGCTLSVTFTNADEARAIVDRCIFVRGLFEVWGSGISYDVLIASLRTDIPQEQFRDRFEGRTFKYVIEVSGRHYTNPQRVDLINKFIPLEHGGKVDLKHPDVVVWVIEEFAKPSSSVTDEDSPVVIYYAFQEHLSRSRDMTQPYELPRRTYLGTTSMPADLSFLMCNMAGVKAGSVVMDPFAGTGSLLVACGHLGVGVNLGGELDSRVLKGRDGCNVASNFIQYNLPAPELLRHDMSRRMFWKCREVLDAIVTDPPYGGRVGSKRVDEVKLEKALGQEGGPNRLIVPLEGYSLADMLVDLMDFSARMLIVGGRLVYWLPTTELYDPAEVPTHPCFKLLFNTQQPITIRLKRRLITMEKVKKFEGEVAPRPEIIRDVHQHEYQSEQYKDYKAKVARRHQAKMDWAEQQGWTVRTKGEKRKQAREDKRQRKRQKESSGAAAAPLADP